MEYNKDFFSEYLQNSQLYYAHLPKETTSCRPPELLSEHSALVFEYAKHIAEKQQLNEIILRLVQSLILKDFANRYILINEIEKLFWRSIAFHDLGKVNKRFQKKQMQNNADVLNIEHPFEHQHSIISVYIFLADFFATFIKLELNQEEQVFLCNVALSLSYPIYRHHQSTLEKTQDEEIWNNENLFVLKPFLSLFKIDLNEDQIEEYHNCFLKNANFHFFFDRFNGFNRTDESFPLFALLKFNYSLLTASDYLATAHYMNNWSEKIIDFCLIDDDLRDRIIHNAENFKYNRPVYEAIEKNEPIDNHLLQKTSNNNLNALRKNIAIEVIRTVKENIDKNLFYIEAPTGGGKTNVSMLALTELLRMDHEKRINKVFYVFPFTTLITQTYRSLTETLGLMDGEIAEIHSKASLQKRTCEREKDEDTDYLNYLDNLFMNFPISLLSHIRFFDVLKTNQKETNYLLHRMANSVVIIDEIQSYTPKMWDKIVYFIINYAKYFNMKFILMSATLPKIGNIITDRKLTQEFVYLIKDKNQYFQNPNFCNRVKFEYRLLEKSSPNKESKTEYLKELTDFLFEKSEEYAKQNILYPNSVHTIIEFIFKKTASEFYAIIKENNDLFDEVFLLSGTILEPRRKEIIQLLKSKEIRDKKVLLISTQVVEAGVDIDMDLGFKDKSIIDSEEQLAGRINRNVNKPQCTLYIFDCDTVKTIYGSDERYRIMREFDLNEYKTILETKAFDKLYQKIIEKINQKNKSSFIENIQDLETAVSTLNYREINNQLQLIDTKNISVFVPIEINITSFAQHLETLKESGIPYNQTVNGNEVWQYYESLIKEQNTNFIINKICVKKLQSLMSNFIFSIFPEGNDYEVLKTYGSEKYGFLYLENHTEIYSFENGINTHLLKDSNFI